MIGVERRVVPRLQQLSTWTHLRQQKGLVAARAALHSLPALATAVAMLRGPPRHGQGAMVAFNGRTWEADDLDMHAAMFFGRAGSWI